jgi:beta-galactosidase
MPMFMLTGRKVGNHPLWLCLFLFRYHRLPDRRTGRTFACSEVGESSLFQAAGIPVQAYTVKCRSSSKMTVSFYHWGTFITTPYITDEVAKVNIKTELTGNDVEVVTEIKNQTGEVVVTKSSNEVFGNTIEQNIAVAYPIRWDIDNPYLYTASF